MPLGFQTVARGAGEPLVFQKKIGRELAGVKGIGLSGS
jgi:hypothetical protein